MLYAPRACLFLRMFELNLSFELATVAFQA